MVHNVKRLGILSIALIIMSITAPLFSGGYEKGGDIRSSGGRLQWITMRASRLSVRHGNVLYKPDEGRKRSVYRTYVMSKRQFFTVHWSCTPKWINSYKNKNL